MLRMFLLVALLLAACVGVCSAAPLEPTEMAYWVDEQGQTPPEEALKARFAPYTGTLSLGYEQHPVWLRLRVPKSTTEIPLVLRVRPAFLGDLTLYRFDEGSHVVNFMRSGRTSRLNENGFQAADLGFLLPPRRHAARRLPAH